MTVTQWCACTLGSLLLGVAPWFFSAWLYASDRVVWECHVAYEVLHLAPDQTVARSVGAYSQFFHGDGSGFSRLSGRKEQGSVSKPRAISTFHRFMEFQYEHMAPYLKKTITKVTREKGDTLNGDQSLMFLKTPGDQMHWQLLKLGRNTYAFGNLGMPRQVCQSRQAWLAPRVR